MHFLYFLHHFYFFVEWGGINSSNSSNKSFAVSKFLKGSLVHWLIGYPSHFILYSNIPIVLFLSRIFSILYNIIPFVYYLFLFNKLAYLNN